jgi:hypothetical protein
MFYEFLAHPGVHHTPNHGGRQGPTAAYEEPIPAPGLQQSPYIIRDKSMSLKLDNYVVFTIY